MALFSRLTLALLSTVEILQTTDVREKEAALKKRREVGSGRKCNRV